MVLVTAELNRIDLSNEGDRDRVRAAMVGLVKSDAWKILAARLHDEREVLIQSLESSSLQGELARNAGRLFQVRAMEKWPELMIKQCDQLAANAKKKEEANERRDERAAVDPTRRA